MTRQRGYRYNRPMKPRPLFPSALRILLLAFLLLPPPAASQPDERAQAIFAMHGAAVVQLRVIDRASGDKSSLGSGFQLDGSGLLATNFHVIAESAHEPERYRLEYLDRNGQPVPLSLVDVDVVHDLALLRARTPLPASLSITLDALSQGERVYSMGNPLDLAMTIIEGTYNGYVRSTRHRRILFSASLNPGMSGGPAVNAAGEVVGVNVARGGEQISFLVPAEYLRSLLARQSDAAWQALELHERMRQALIAEQEQFFAALLAEPWQLQAFGEFRIPGRISPTLRCWGGSSNEASYRFEHAYQECDSQDDIFVADDFETGSLHYAFHRFGSAELNDLQFYNLLAAHYQHEQYFNVREEKQVSNYRCSEDFVRSSRLDWRISYCARRYRQFGGLFDVSVVFVTNRLVERGLVVRLGISGISESRAVELLRRFLEAIEWTP